MAEGPGAWGPLLPPLLLGGNGEPKLRTRKAAGKVSECCLLRAPVGFISAAAIAPSTSQDMGLDVGQFLNVG